MLAIICIYKIQSLTNPDRFYIGSTINFKERKRLHVKHLKANKHHSILLQRHANKYGIDDLKFEILEELSDKKLLIEKEQFFIDSTIPYFNICKTASNCLGVKLSEETKRKMSLSKTGKPRSIETKLKISEAHKGKKLKPETIEKMRNSLTGKKHSNETKEKMKLAAKNNPKVISQETREKLSRAAKNRVYSPELKLKLSEAAKNRKRTKRGPYKKKDTDKLKTA